MAWVDKDGDIGIPAKGLFTIIFSVAGYCGICGIIHVLLARRNESKGPVSTSDSLMEKLLRSQQFWYRLVFLIMAGSIGGSTIGSTCEQSDDPEDSYCKNWHLMFWYSLIVIVTANLSFQPFEFYMGEGVTFVDTMRFYLLNAPLPTAEETAAAVQEKYLRPDAERAQGIGFWTLMPSAFITWIFAKSIRNSSVLGARFGMLGGLAYDSWYLSFFSCAIVCYLLRTRYNFQSLPTAVFRNYGAVAVFCFQLCVMFRLFNEVWSNASVIGGFYGPSGSSGYWGAVWFSVFVPVIYVVMGGMRSSLFSDVFQAFLAVVFLVVVLATIGSDKDFSDNTNAFKYQPSSTMWSTEGGWQGGWWAYTIAGCIGGMISYPFFDPVLTDRAFLAKPKTMLLSFFVGGSCAMLFIFFYAVIGVYGAWLKEKYAVDCACSAGVKGGAATSACPTSWNPCSKLVGTTGEASDVAWILGRRTYIGAEIFINLVMISASLSTLDSTFTSASKMMSLEWCGWLKLKGDSRAVRGPLRPIDLGHISESHMNVARAFIVLLGFIGTCFLGYEKDAMKATTVAGLSIMGIGMPIWWMTIWRVKKEGRKGWRQAPLAFVVPFALGVFFGISYYIHGNDNTDRTKWCKANDPTSKTCVTDKQGWTYDLNVGTYTLADGSEARAAYGRLLGTSMLGHGACICAFFLFFVLHQVIPMTEEVEPEPEGGSVIGVKEEPKEVQSLSTI